ncbi:MAG TPA: ABC transporter substrate-binding protein [Burkholderiales bacterium]|jgi:branched-chain amino acid transport system substrate-binding protein
MAVLRFFGGKRRRMVCLLLSVIAAFCGVPAARADEYVVGILTPATGDWSPIGKSMRNGIALALEQAEDHGRFREGVRLSLQDYDENQAPAELAERTQRMVQANDAILVIGPMFSSHAQWVAATANRYSFPLLSPAISENVNAAGPWSFRSSVSPHFMIEAMARSAFTGTNAKKIAIVYPAGNAGFQAQAAVISRIATQMHRLVTAEIMMPSADDTAFEDTAATLATAQADLLFICMDAEPAAVLASRLRRAGVPKSSRFVFTPAAAQPALLQVGHEYVENALVAADYLPQLPGELNKAFVASYQKRYGALPDRWAGIGFTTGLIAAEGIRNAGPRPSRQLVRDGLERVLNLSVPMGDGKWMMGPRHEPRYGPAFFTIRNGEFVPFEP